MGREKDEEWGLEEEGGGTRPGKEKDREKGGREVFFPPPSPSPGPRHQAATQRLSSRTCHSLPGEGAGLPRPGETRVGTLAGTERACRVRTGFRGCVGSSTTSFPEMEKEGLQRRQSSRDRL